MNDCNSWLQSVCFIPWWSNQLLDHSSSSDRCCCWFEFNSSFFAALVEQREFKEHANISAIETECKLSYLLAPCYWGRCIQSIGAFPAWTSHFWCISRCPFPLSQNVQSVHCFQHGSWTSCCHRVVHLACYSLWKVKENRSADAR